MDEICFTNIKLFFDIGSGKTKSYFFGMDSCTNSSNLISKYRAKMPYQYYIVKGNLSKKAVENGLQSLVSIQNYYEVECNIVQCSGIATAWARNAANTDEYLQKVYNNLNINIQVISQYEEGKFLFQAAEKELHLAENRAIVCDIGGGSFQLSFRGFDSSIQVVEGLYGGENFKLESQKFLIANFDTRYLDNRFLNNTEILHIKEFGRKLITGPLKNNQELQEWIKKGSVSFYAAGGLMNTGIKGMINDNHISLNTLYDLADQLSKYDFEKARNHFDKVPEIESNQYNLLLAESIMIGLNVSEAYFIQPDIPSFLVNMGY